MSAPLDILLVEDSATQAMRLQAYLQEKGLTVATAGDGVEALEFLATRQPRLVICDIVMPKMDGIELCRRLKADAALQRIPVVLWTQLESEYDHKRATAAGATAVVRKPLGHDVLNEAVQRLLARSAAHAEVKLLLVEDSATQAAQLEEALQSRGYQVRVAVNGRQALDLMRQDPPHLVLSDIRMPVMDGLELCRAIKQDPDLRAIPVILLTSLSSATDVLAALEAGADFHIPKPYHGDYLLGKIDAILAHGSAAASPSAEPPEMVDFEGDHFTISASREQVLRLLLSTYEVAVQQNREVAKAREALERQNATLEQTVRERTAALKEESDEARRAVEALRESEARLRDITSSMGDWVWEVDEAGVYTYASAKGVEMLGDVIGKTPFDFMPPDEAERVRETFEDLVGRRAPIRDLENWNTTKNGEAICLLTNGVPILDADGRLTGYRGVDKDITERKNAEATIRESEGRFRTIFNDAPLGVALVDSATARFSQVNPRVAAILGRTIEEMITLDWMSLTHPDDQQKSDDIMALLKAGEIPGLAITKRYLRPDGTHVWCNTTITRLTAGDVNRPQYLVMLEDISERVSSEAMLRLGNAALAAAANAIVITDREGVIEWANAAFTTFSGYSIEEAVGCTPGQLLKSGTQDEAFYQAMWHTIQLGDVWHGEVVNRRKDGSLYTEEITITPLRNERSEITHFIAVMQDITQEKALEEQFRQSQKMEAVGRLAGGVAHDFNNMLSVILGRAELVLLQTEATEPSRAHLLEIEEAAKRSASLTRQLLAFARRQTVMPEVLDLNETVADSLRMLQRLIGENIRLGWQPAPMLWPIRIDTSQVDQILANLCINVRDAIADVGSLVIVTANCRLDAAFCAAHVGAEPGEYVRLTVSDTGCGMDAATLAQVFDPFFTTKEVGKGTGLGLSTVYGAVKQNGGYVTVASEPGQGTTFEIYLPRYVGEEGPEDASGADADTPRGDETILLVEDEPVVLELTTEMLQAQGYTVFAAGSPAAAIRLAEAHAGEIDLLLTDVIMPEMNGRELADKVLAFHPHVACLFMSGYTADIIGPYGVLDEETHFLGKPFSFAALAKAVRKALEGRRSKRSP